MGADGKFAPHPRNADAIDAGRLGGARSIADDLGTTLRELVQLRKDGGSRQVTEALRSHDLITREEALRVIYFKRDTSANYAIKMDPTKTISQHLRAITSNDERAKRKLQKVSKEGCQMVFSVPLKGIEGKGKVYTIIDAKKFTMHTVLISDMNVLVPVVISIDEEPVDDEGDDSLFEDMGEDAD